MALTTRLELRHSQQLVMTPQLQQAIRLLQLSNVELTEFVDQELERNPLLERLDSTQSTTEPGDAPQAAEHNASADPGEWPDAGQALGDAPNTLDTDFENVYPDTAASDAPANAESGWASLRSGASLGDADVNLEAFVACETSLKDHLTAQLALAFPSPADQIVGRHLIDLVDDTGYLVGDVHAVAAKLGAPDAAVDRILAVMQSFDPPGVLARSLGECLALQLREQNRYDPVIARLLDNLPLLAAHDIAALRRAVGVDMDELAEMIAEIKQLNPKPGLKFGSVQIQPVVPDVLVRPGGDHGWLVELNTETLPRVLVNRVYFARVSKVSSDTDKTYMIDCLQSANWLVKSLDQRARTILRVAEEIVRQQDGFLMYGVQHLRPLNLKTIAEAISMHESTVSRVTSNKYISTPRGIFELKYFFTSSIASSGDGDAHSSESVRHRIRQLIDGETPRLVLSDDQIVEMLKTDGVDIARRTVAKYREAMRIPSSVQRRREKRLSEQMSRAGA